MRTHIFNLVYRSIRMLERIFPSRNRIPVIMYHRVSDAGTPLTITTNNFRKQMEFLHDEGYEAITLGKLQHILENGDTTNTKKVAITFDDGYQNNLTQAKPIMDGYGFPGTVFVTTSQIGEQHASADEEVPEGYVMLTKEELQELEGSGWCVANHTHTHRKLTKISDEEIKGEVTAAREVLQDVIQNQQASLYLAVPHDRADERVLDTLELAGMQLVCAGKGIARITTSPRQVPRTEVPDTVSRAQFLAYLSPWYYRVLPMYFFLKKFGLFRAR